MNYRLFLYFATFLFVGIGCGLLFSPKSWFPDFYTPIFVGVIALISPLLVSLPRVILSSTTPEKDELIQRMSVVIAFSLLLNLGGELGLFQLYKFGFEYDKFTHFLVPMIFAFVLGEALLEWKQFSLRKRIMVTFMIVFLSGLAWELFEMVSDHLFETQEWGVYGQDLVADTSKDIFFNTLGAIAGIIIFIIPKGRNKK